MGDNRGFRIRNHQVESYTQEKLGLSAYYDKRIVLPDGIHTKPHTFQKEDYFVDPLDAFLLEAAG